jgi:hypothetical protein
MMNKRTFPDHRNRMYESVLYTRCCNEPVGMDFYNLTPIDLWDSIEYNAIVSWWLLAVVCFGLCLNSLLLSSIPSSSSYIFSIISLDNALQKAWKYILSSLPQTQYRKQRNVLTSDTARKKASTRSTYQCVFHVSSTDSRIWRKWLLSSTQCR